MPKFLNTSATTYHLEELIKNASERLFLISPFLKFNERIRELLEDKNRMKIDVRIIYGKNELQPEEIGWLKSLDYVRLSFCKNLHAKCYLNEQSAIITSMNLYEFSQVNNNEMGVLILRETDGELYQETYRESQRLVRISEEIKMSVERIAHPDDAEVNDPGPSASAGSDGQGRQISTSQLSKKLNLPGKVVFGRLMDAGWIKREGDAWVPTPLGISRGAEVRRSKQYGDYIVWPEDIRLP
jgi:phosphatidylserine/phosphatidylglycerophosphate/cardiolipin synthase-like enzyme